MKEKRIEKVAIIGAGRGGATFLRILSDYHDLDVVGITDINPDAPGIKLAKRLGISIFQNYLDFLKIKDLDLIINLSGDSSVGEDINKSIERREKGERRRNKIDVLDGMSARLVWELVTNAKHKEDEKAELAQEMAKLNRDLSDVKEYPENILEHSADMIITTNLDKKIISFNRGAENILGYSKEDVIGKDINFLWKNKEERKRLLKELERHGHVSNYETELVAKDNHFLHVSLTLSHLKNQVGEIIGTVGISKDISVKKKVEQELLRSNRELEDFVYLISHDLQTPLRAIYGFSELLIEGYKEGLDNEIIHYLERIKKGAKRMKLLIDDLLELSRVSHKKSIFEKVDILEILKTIQEPFHFDLKEKKGEIKLVTDFPSIYCDRTRIQQVFSNFISNAIKFNNNNPLIEIGYTEREDAHEFFVKDNGIGIAPDYHQKIFNIFQRLHIVEEYEGTGIGLTIVKAIVEIHHGDIWLESAPKQGTTFYFTIDKNICNIV